LITYRDQNRVSLPQPLALLTLFPPLLGCSKLSSLSLVPLTAKCHSLSTLILAGAGVFPDGLLALSNLKKLSKLDLSYTEIESLEPIFEECSRLKVRGFGFWMVGFVWRFLGAVLFKAWIRLDLSCTEIESLDAICEACSHLQARGLGF
jgi:hypothetical protein